MAVERELKLVLANETEVSRLEAQFDRPFREALQRNSYWDLPGGELSSADMLLRLRIEESQAFWTVKEKSSTDGSGTFTAEELEGTVEVGLAQTVTDEGRGIAPLLSPEVYERLTQRFGSLEPLFVWGSMENLRRWYPLVDNAYVEIDRTRFDRDQMEYEVEVEHTELSTLESRLRELLAAAEVPWRVQTRSKSDRLRDYLKGAS